jgi:hypothetical protein
MDVFSAIVEQSRAYLREAAAQAARELGVFAAPREVLEPALAEATLLTAGPLSRALGLPGAHRLRALLGVLRLERLDRAPLARPQPPQGWGLLAQVIRRDRPLPEPVEALAAFHEHLRLAGAEAARELAPLLGEGPLVDLGGGTGAYTAAFLEAQPRGTATLVDRAAVLALAQLPPRARKLECNLLSGRFPEAQGAALLANVLHLFGPGDCARIIESARAALRPGGALVIKDLDARQPSGIYFALNMALYTEAGDVHSAEAIERWLGPCEQHRLKAAPDAVVLIARTPEKRVSEP